MAEPNSSEIKITAPGKVIIAGEYGVLCGGHCLLIPQKPEFTLRAILRLPRTNAASLVSPFAPGSPAGRLFSAFYQRYSELFAALVWEDPYKTPIGVGSSSAQFILLAKLLALYDEGFHHAYFEAQNQKVLHAVPENLIQLYWELVGASQGLQPSGSDVALQYAGGPLSYRMNPYEAKALPACPLQDSTFSLVFTGSKMKTHEHLLELKQRGFPSTRLDQDALSQIESLTLELIQMWGSRSGDALVWGQILNNLAESLAIIAPLPNPIAEGLAEIQAHPDVWGAKMSGAQGGDCILVLHKKSLTGSNLSSLTRHRGWDVFPAPEGTSE